MLLNSKPQKMTYPMFEPILVQRVAYPSQEVSILLTRNKP